ncbi:MAG TPA: TlpA disulfide reductase family protein [Phycisphaerales bacterium]|nr:TlpA disulfide reductase family protein [Phycisphaerales bacterium]
MHTHLCRIALPSIVLALCTGLALAQNDQTSTPPAKKPGDPAPLTTAPTSASPVEQRWLDDLPALDRSLLNELVGYAPPAFTKDLQWVGSDAVAWNSLRGKVVLIQSWTSGTDPGRRAILRAQNIVEKLKNDDVRLLALHTPDNADKAATYLERKPVQGAISIIDPSGEFCDALGIYKTPINILIDRQGAVRYVGLNVVGLNKALQQLIDQPYDPNMTAAQRPSELPAAAESAEFPKTTGPVQYALDIRGKSAPEFAVNQWKSPQPDLKGKVVVIDFWATWCGPCRQAIPHMNTLQEKFGDDVVCIGLSDESDNDFELGLDKYHLNLRRDFKYSVALDNKKRMISAVRVTGIPHCIVMSSDWIVRWQGMPGSLNEATLKKIVEANRSLNPSSSPQGSSRNRWARSATH